MKVVSWICSPLVKAAFFVYALGVVIVLGTKELKDELRNG